MLKKPQIGGTPVFDNPFSHCTFLGRVSGYDLYLTQEPGRAPDVLARSGGEPGEYIEGFHLSYGISRPLTVARRIAEYRRLLPAMPLKAMFHAVEDEDVSSVKKALALTPEYRVLLAYQMGDSVEVSRILDALIDAPELVEKYPDNVHERLRHVDMLLFVAGHYLGDFFLPGTCANVAFKKMTELGCRPLQFGAE